MSAFFFVRALSRVQFGQSSVVVGAASREEAAKRAREMAAADADISIVAMNGQVYTVDEFETWAAIEEPPRRDAMAA